MTNLAEKLVEPVATEEVAVAKGLCTREGVVEEWGARRNQAESYGLWLSGKLKEEILEPSRVVAVREAVGNKNLTLSPI